MNYLSTWKSTSKSMFLHDFWSNLLNFPQSIHISYREANAVNIRVPKMQQALVLVWKLLCTTEATKNSPYYLVLLWNLPSTTIVQEQQIRRLWHKVLSFEKFFFWLIICRNVLNRRKGRTSTYFWGKLHPSVEGSLPELHSCLDKSFTILAHQIPIISLGANAAVNHYNK